jgi:hypothetical protein
LVIIWLKRWPASALMELPLESAPVTVGGGVGWHESLALTPWEPLPLFCDVGTTSDVTVKVLLLLLLVVLVLVLLVLLVLVLPDVH